MATDLLTPKSTYGDWRDFFFEHGYAILKNAITSERAEYYKSKQVDWLKSFGRGFDPEDESTWTSEHLPVSFKGGMYGSYCAPHERFAWEARMEPGVMNPFIHIWETDELLVSFDMFNITLPRQKDLKWSPWPRTISTIIDRPPIANCDMSTGFTSRGATLQDTDPSVGLQSLLEPSQVPLLVSVYSIICISADEDTGALAEVGTHYLTAAYSLLAHVISTPYLSSVQTLVLLTIALRGRSKEGQGWQTLGQAIRIAHSVGLHCHASTRHSRRPPESKASAPSPGYQTDRKLHSQVWWACYALEKLMELETGRPSAIHDSDCGQKLPDPVPVSAAGIASSAASDIQHDHHAIDYFQPWASLSRIISSISAHIYRRSGQSQTSRILLGDTVRLDSALTAWAQSLPPEIRPPGPNSGNVFLCESGHKHMAIFLAIQYHHALISLHRAALVFPESMYRTHINSQADSGALSAVELTRLRRGAEICIGSARAIVRLVGEIADDSTPTPRASGGMFGEASHSRSESVIFTITQPLISAVALALHILKQPSSRLARSDLELLGIAAQYAEEQYTKVGQNPSFIQACSVLQSNMSEIVSGRRQHRGSAVSSVAEPLRAVQTPAEDSNAGNANADMSIMDFELPDLTGMFTEISNTDIFGGVRLEHLWGMLGADGQLAEESGTWEQ